VRSLPRRDAVRRPRSAADHQSLELDWDIEADELVAYNWETAEWSAFLFYVEYLPEKSGGVCRPYQKATDSHSASVPKDRTGRTIARLAAH
jgi:hypothetical protein